MSLQRIGLVLILCVVAVGASGGQVVEQNEQPSLGDIARATRKKSADRPTAHPEVKALVDQFNAEHQESGGDMPQLSVDVNALLTARRYDELDKAAERARASKARAAGGIWQLYLFYKGITDAAVENPQLVNELKNWADTRPQSITARVALAQVYVEMGFKARGGGYADTVTDAGWVGLSEGADRSLAMLNQASAIGGDPHVYYLLMNVALAQGWDREHTRELFERALSAEPGYYHTFRQYANYLLPKWYGEGAEAEELGEELSRRVGGKEGLFLYFEVATVVGCDCGQSTRLEHMSWDKIKAGYAALQELYGANNRDNNRLALLAVTQQDKATAQAAFQKVSNWESDVWSSRSRFETARAWALQP